MIENRSKKKTTFYDCVVSTERTPGTNPGHEPNRLYQHGVAMPRSKELIHKLRVSRFQQDPYHPLGKKVYLGTSSIFSNRGDLVSAATFFSRLAFFLLLIQTRITSQLCHKPAFSDGTYLNHQDYATTFLSLYKIWYVKVLCTIKYQVYPTLHTHCHDNTGHFTLRCLQPT